MTREYRIEDNGEDVQLYLYEGEMQMGGALFPEEGDGSAWDLATEVGEDWIA